MKPTIELSKSMICFVLTFFVSIGYSQAQNKQPHRLSLDEMKARNQRIMALKKVRLHASQQNQKIHPPAKLQPVSSMAVRTATDHRQRLVHRKVVFYRLPTKKVRPQKYVYNTETGSVRKAPPGRLLPTQVAEDPSSHSRIEQHHIGVKLTAVKPQAKPQVRRGIASTP